MSIFKKTLILSSAISLILSPSAMASKRLSGAGATFPSKIYTRWFFDLAKSGGPRVNYQAVGSGSGRKAFIDETVNFGASDDPMKDSDIEKVKRGLVQIPMVGGTIAFGYNYDCNLYCLLLSKFQITIIVISESNSSTNHRYLNKSSSNFLYIRIFHRII